MDHNLIEAWTELAMTLVFCAALRLYGPAIAAIERRLRGEPAPERSEAGGPPGFPVVRGLFLCKKCGGVHGWDQGALPPHTYDKYDLIVHEGGKSPKGCHCWLRE